MLRPSEAFKATGVGRSKGYELIATGEWPHVKIGKRGIRIPVDALREWIDKNLCHDGQPDQEPRAKS